MKTLHIITEPTVRLIGRPDMAREVIQEFLDDKETYWETSEGDADAEYITEFAGRVCYLAFGEKQGRRDNKSHLDNILKSGHGSVLEHVVWNFLVTGVSRSFTHELVRHRAGFAFSQVSQRFIDSSETAFVAPELISRSAEALGEWSLAVNNARWSYARLVDVLETETKASDQFGKDRRKKVREAARSVLPNATEAPIVFSANARALRHFIEYRATQHADAEICAVAMKVLTIMKIEAPHLFGDYSAEPTGDGRSYAITYMEPKV